MRWKFLELTYPLKIADCLIVDYFRYRRLAPRNFRVLAMAMCLNVRGFAVRKRLHVARLVNPFDHSKVRPKREVTAKDRWIHPFCNIESSPSNTNHSTNRELVKSLTTVQFLLCFCRLVFLCLPVFSFFFCTVNIKSLVISLHKCSVVLSVSKWLFTLLTFFLLLLSNFKTSYDAQSQLN